VMFIPLTVSYESARIYRTAVFKEPA